MPRYRKERDVLGSVKVPTDAYYGSETQRAINNFPISGISLPNTFIRHYAMIKKAAALTHIKFGKLESKKGSAIVKACNELIAGMHAEQFTTDIYQAGAGTSVNMNLNEVIANRAIEILGGRKGNYKLVHPNDDVNMSQSTNDTFHACIHLTVYDELHNTLIPRLERLQKAFFKKAMDFRNIVKIGRTHMQDAVPMTLGEEFSGYASALERQIKSIKMISDALLDVSLGGTAVGTGIEAYKGYSKAVVKELRKISGVQLRSAHNFFDIQQNQIEELWVSGALRSLATLLNKISNDLRLLSSGPRSGLGEITLPPVQPGSSIMPGKINPSIPEMLIMVSLDVAGKDKENEEGALLGQLELNVYMPIIAYNLLYSIEILSKGVDVFRQKCVIGIKANEERIKQHIEENLSLATALAPHIGYSRAAAIARKALKENKTLRQVCLDQKLFTKEELKKILDSKALARVG